MPASRRRSSRGSTQSRPLDQESGGRGGLDGRSLDEGVQRALDALPPDYRMAIVLADLEGFSYKEIAEILEIPVGTVMSRLYRGRKRLEEAMLRYARGPQLPARRRRATRRRTGEGAAS